MKHNNNTVILFDIDYTLFDQETYRTCVFQHMQALLPQVAHIPLIAQEVYDEIRKDGWFEENRYVEAFIKRIGVDINADILRKVWEDEKLLEEALYPEALDVVATLSSKGFILGIFSSGYTTFQKSKIAKIAHFFDEEHIHIHELKDEKLNDIVQQYNGKHIYLVDDYIPVIEKAKQTDPSITAIWMKRGRLSEKVAQSKEYPPDYTVTNLTDLLSIIPRN